MKVYPSHKLEGHAYEQQSHFKLNQDVASQRNT